MQSLRRQAADARRTLPLGVQERVGFFSGLQPNNMRWRERL